MQPLTNLLQSRWQLVAGIFVICTLLGFAFLLISTGSNRGEVSKSNAIQIQRRADGHADPRFTDFIESHRGKQLDVRIPGDAELLDRKGQAERSLNDIPHDKGVQKQPRNQAVSSTAEWPDLSQSQQPNENTSSSPNRSAEKQGEIQPTDLSPTEAKRLQEEWARRLDFATVVTNSSGIQFALIPPGQFLMGSSDSSLADQEDEQPQHPVTISRAFFISSHEITIEQFSDFVKATGYGITQPNQVRDRQKEAPRRGPPSWARGGGQVNQNENNKDGKAERQDDEESPPWLPQFRSRNRSVPIVHVSWHDAQAWCRWMSQKESKTYRLPTEAEWEYAARGGTQTDFYSGDEKSILNFAWFEANSGGEMQVVGRKRPNVWGLYDMFGNAREWCDDWYGAYRDSAQTDPRGASRGEVRVVRGGAADSTPVRAAFRDYYDPGFSSTQLGFRVVCEVDSAKKGKK